MTLFARSSDGLAIAYETVGEGAPVVLVHGFASSRVQNWKDPGWFDALARAGYRVIALDVRGHGESDKPHDPTFYGHDVMMRDVEAVMEAVGISTARMMGYSMGGFIGIQLLMRRPDLVERIVIGGVGETYLDDEGTSRDPMNDPDTRNAIMNALLTEDKAAITDPAAKAFRTFAEQPGKDRRALAACLQAPRRMLKRAELAHSARPVLVVCGEKDRTTGSPEPLAAAFADGRAVIVPGRDHMTVVGDKVYKDAAVKFLAA